jgi:hypothetical protein
MKTFLSSLMAGLAALLVSSAALGQQPTTNAQVYTAPANNLYPGYTGNYQPTYRMPVYNYSTQSYRLPANPYYNGPQYIQGTPSYAVPPGINAGVVNYQAPAAYNTTTFGGVRYPGNVTFTYPTYTGVIHYPGGLNYYFYTPYIFRP